MKYDSFFTSTTRRDFIRQAACAAVGTVAMRNCMRDMHLLTAALAQGPFTDYKALVCIFLAGGNDSNNLIIPTIASEYANYAKIRTPVLAIPNADGSAATAQALNPHSRTGDNHTYGLNPAAKELADMFNNDNTASSTYLGKVATVFNTGTLVYPLTKAQYNANVVAKPPQLFSHSDQVTQWQTSIPDQAPSTGWGGRIADFLHSSNPQTNGLDALSMCVTIGGANTFEIGASAQQYSVGTGGIVALSNPSNPSSATAGRSTALTSILSSEMLNPNLFTSNYAYALNHSVSTGAALATGMNYTALPVGSGTTTTNANATNSYWNTAANWSKTTTINQVLPPNGSTAFTSSLMQQLKMVARIIEAGYRSSGVNGGLGMKRQIFFVTVGGYDTHTNQTNAANATPTAANVVVGSQANLLAELSQSIYWFQTAIKTMEAAYPGSNLMNSVTCFTASDFGRTFPSNGLGSDHGWGSHHIVVGGAVNGRRTFGTFPTLTVGGPDDVSTGRWIPTTAVDQYAGEFANWMGVSKTNMAVVLPNVTRFSGSYETGYVSVVDPTLPSGSQVVRLIGS